MNCVNRGAANFRLVKLKEKKTDSVKLFFTGDHNHIFIYLFICIYIWEIKEDRGPKGNSH
jgi:hypothetical protein